MLAGGVQDVQAPRAVVRNVDVLIDRVVAGEHGSEPTAQAESFVAIIEGSTPAARGPGGVDRAVPATGTVIRRTATIREMVPALRPACPSRHLVPFTAIVRGDPPGPRTPSPIRNYPRACAFKGGTGPGPQERGTRSSEPSRTDPMGIEPPTDRDRSGTDTGSKVIGRPHRKAQGVGILSPCR